jgi:hypothetical protein
MDSPLPTPVSQSPSQGHPKRARTDDDNAKSTDSGDVGINLGNSLLGSRHTKRPRGPPDSDPHRQVVETTKARLLALNPRQAPISPPEAVLPKIEPYNPFITNPDHGGKGPKLRYEDLDEYQSRVIDKAVFEGKNICIVGGAGTGKSGTCEILLDELRLQDKGVAIVTPSGTSAVNVHAQTLHSFFGLGAESNKGIDEYIDNMKPSLVEKLQMLYTLVIDEISMVSYPMFDRMDMMCRAARGKDQPFGGIQLIVFGGTYSLSKSYI